MMNCCSEMVALTRNPMERRPVSRSPSLYKADMIRDAFKSLRTLELVEYEADLNEGARLAGPRSRDLPSPELSRRRNGHDASPATSAAIRRIRGAYSSAGGWPVSGS
jgi:hypothetical protein